MTREASVATLRRLAEAVDAYGKEMVVWDPPINPVEQMTTYWRVADALAAYRSEIAPLRTRAEVDAEIAALTRQCVDDEWAGDDDYAKWEQVTKLCREPTAPGPAPTPGRWRVGTRVPEHVYLDDKPICTMPSADLARAVVAAMNSGPSSADAEEVPSPRPPASPAGAAISKDPAIGEFCGIEVHRSENGLYMPLQEWGRFWLTGSTCDLSGAIRDLQMLQPSGPPGAAAAKESRDNAAAPEGAAKAGLHPCNPGERECNCDQALGLERELERFRDELDRTRIEAAGLKRRLADIRMERSLYMGRHKSAVDALAAIGLILREP